MEDKSIGKIISIIARQNQSYVVREMNKIGITGSEYAFIANIPCDNVITQQEICDDLEVDPAFATRSIKSLIDKGYVKKDKSAKDKRAYHLMLTKKGVEKKKQVRDRLKIRSEIINGDLTSEEIELLFQLLLDIKERLKTKQMEGTIHE